MNNMKDMSKVIAEKRKKAGLTQEAFAMQLGITPQAISKWENGVGFPDITLLPNIAKVLNVSIDELFTKEHPRKNIQLPETHNGLPMIFSKGNRACYSSKEIDTISEDGKIFFKDGSTADINEGSAENKGIGEINFYETDDVFEEEKETPESIYEDLPFFISVSAALNIACEAKILRSEDGIARIEAKGSQKFMRALKYEVSEDKLKINLKSQNNVNSGNGSNNKLKIYVPFEKGQDIDLTINGSSDCEIEPDFEKSNLMINGSGDITLANTDILSATINGSGDINIDCVSKETKIQINGSGDISIDTANNVSASINGSGYINIDTASGNLCAKVMGSGDFSVSGEVEYFDCFIMGCGDVNAEELTTTDAEITLSGAADVTIGHILKSSKEKISKQSTLTVLKRG